MNDWYKIDNAGQIYSSITSTRVTTFFRISVTLKDDINVDVGNKALKKVLKRFPYLDVQIKAGFFWYYLHKGKGEVALQEEQFYPCMNLYIKKSGVYLFRILYFKNKLSFEFSHILLDGQAALVFINTFLIEYFKNLGINSIHDKIYDLDYFSESERENSFEKYYNKKIPTVKTTTRAHKLPLKLCEKGSFFVVSGLMELSEIKDLSKKHNCTIYIFLTAVYIKSIIETSKEKIKKPIVINAPVSLKPYFESETLCNFFTSLTPTVDPRLGEYTLEEIVDVLKKYFDTNLNKKVLSQYISTTVRYENNKFFKATPLFLKAIILPAIYKIFGENTYTSSVSNLGIFSVPKEISEYVTRIDVFPAPSKNNIVKTAMISYGSKISFSFSKLTTDTELERVFFTNLRKMGINILVDSNRNENGGV